MTCSFTRDIFRCTRFIASVSQVQVALPLSSLKNAWVDLKQRIVALRRGETEFYASTCRVVNRWAAAREKTVTKNAEQQQKQPRKASSTIHKKYSKGAKVGPLSSSKVEAKKESCPGGEEDAREAR